MWPLEVAVVYQAVLAFVPLMLALAPPAVAGLALSAARSDSSCETAPFAALASPAFSVLLALRRSRHIRNASARLHIEDAISIPSTAVLAAS